MTVATNPRVQGPVLLVGSMPFDTVEEVLRTSGRVIGSQVSCLPDGEIGDRETWVGFLPLRIFSGHPDLEESHRPAGGLQQPEHDDSPEARPGAADEALWTFRIKPGVTALRFEDLGYGRFAIDSYDVFRRLREEGVIPHDVRFQVCLPAASSAIDAFFDDTGDWPAVHAAYIDGLGREIEKMLEHIPAEELVIQIDLAWEVVDLAVGDARYFRFWPDETFEQKLARHSRLLAELSAHVPEQVPLGYHWCYGTWGGWPMAAMRDLDLCVRLSNETVRQAPRSVDYVHMPVIRDPDEAFFAPLGDLDIGETRVFLGLIHHTDGVDRFRERVHLARRHLPSFGIGSVCGYGRVDKSELPTALRVHHDCATVLTRDD
jgi:hypothetical protein